MVFLEIPGVLTGDIWWVVWRYLIGFLDNLDGFPGDVLCSCWRYLVGFLEIFDGFP